MAKKLTVTERSKLRDELGLNTKPGEVVPFEMPRPLDPAASGLSNADINAQAVAQETGEKPSQWEVLKASVAQDNSIVDLLKETPTFPIDMEFKGGDFWNDVKPRIDAMVGVDKEEIMEDVVGAMSASEAEWFLSEHEKDYANEQVLMEAGAKALLTRMAVSIADPIDIGLAIASGGTAGALLKGKKFGRIATAAIAAGTATGGTEAYLSSNNASRDETDVLFATVAGIGLGGGISGLMLAREAKQLQKLSDQVATGQIDEAAEAIGANTGDSTTGSRRRASESLEPDKRLAGDAVENVEEALSGVEAPDFKFERLQKLFRTMQSKVFFSPSETVRKAASKMLEGGYLKGRGVRQRTAEGTANLLRRTFEAGIFRESLPEFRAWAKANGIGNVKRNIGSRAGEEFYSEVGRAMRGEVEGLSKEAVSAAKKLRKYMDNMYALADKAGVKGFGTGDIFDDLRIDVDGASTLVSARRTRPRTEAEANKETGLGDDEAGKIELQERGGTQLQVTNSVVQTESRFLGNGGKLYDQAARIADERGLTLTSDTSVSESAARLWGSMERKGDTIIDQRVTNPDNVEKIVEDGVTTYKTKNGTPVFTREVGAERPRAELKGGMLDDYFPRMINRQKFDEVRTQYGNQALSDWFSRAIVDANEEIDQDLADLIAKNYVHTMSRKIAGIENELLHGIRLDDIPRLRETFEGSPELEDMITQIEAMKARENLKRGTVSFAKRRITFNERFEAPIKLPEDMGGAERSLKFHELYENDARKVLKRYGHSMSGHIGMAAELGIKSRNDWETFEKAIMDEASATSRNLDEAKQETETLREAYDLLIGRNTIDGSPNGDFSKAARTWTGYTYTTRGGQFGVNALAEFGNVIGAIGLRSFIRSMPEWKSLMKRGVDGEIEHDFARTLEVLFAPGINGLTGVAIRNMDEFGERMDGSSLTSRVATKLDNPLRVGGRATATASGLNLLTDLPQRLAGVEMIRKFARFAAGGKISEGQAARIRAMGIDDKMRQRIFDQINAARVDRNGRMIDLDIEKWADDEALDALNFGINREVRSIIQENDISTVTRYFHHPAGRILMQFLRFPMEAVNKQLARSIHFADAEAVKSFMSALFITSTAYIAQTSIDFANDPEERKKRLTPENIAKVAFMRTGISSMIPTATDIAFPILGGKVLGGWDDQNWVNQDGKLFSYGRSSGFTTGVMGNPVFSTVDSAYRLGGNLSASILSGDQQIAQQDVRDLSKMIPGYRLLGVSNAINAIAEMFPEERKE